MFIYFGWGSILYSQKSGFFCVGAKFEGQAEHCEGIWVCKGVCALTTGACHMLQDTRELLMCGTTAMAPSSVAEQRALTFEHEALVHRSTNILPPCPAPSLWYWGNSTKLCCWWMIDLISCSFFPRWTFTWRPALPLLMKNLSKQPVMVARKV